MTEALDLAGFITPEMLIASNMGICAKVDGKTVLKSPDWFYVPEQEAAKLREILRKASISEEKDVD